MTEQSYKPDYIFEASWEVCNKVGGIYTVLSTKAKSMQEMSPDRVVFIGPDVWTESENPWFKEDKKLLADWKIFAKEEDRIEIRIGRWNVPGTPIVVLVSFKQFFPAKDAIYGDMWHKFGVDSLNAYGDYDESCMFAYASGVVIESFYKYHRLEDKKVIAHFDEWMLGMGALYVKSRLPRIGTVFTTHATSIGRSIAGNGKPLYNYLDAYDSDQMARELNMEAKHSVEKTAAQQVDCFTTVSDITAKECAKLLHREPFVTPNGFEKDFIPEGEKHKRKRIVARKKMIDVAEKLLGYDIQEDALLVATSGRYEYRNKGLDVFVDAMHRLENIQQLEKDVIAFIMVPAWISGPRVDLQERLKLKRTPTGSLSYPYVTHWLRNMNNDSILNQISYLKMENRKEDRVKIIFVPSYLNGNDGIFDMPYYDLLIGLDVTVFPSYYEPWGYTPHESIAFSVPTITSSLAGFGLWMRKMGDEKGMDDGAEVITRDDYNFIEVSEEICNRVFEMTTKSNKEENILRQAALERAGLADWAHFYKYYEEAYDIALRKAQSR
ncbi:glycogen/starch synthase [Dysgonomonas sp. Marseille-P4677]|uniref:glycogen/starch synthase n=1 Tax=Dysgonomonas sp. Marseille-P4677 TaxID=2364790 RepID=UPI001912F5AE|nr:glycogen/starch synthase [Dysgonomonas sp. Marseille-P4677]MBK5721729.1 glycogen/starch synthase [Dysgonomonas sp. Marseille-P4677]